MSENTDNPICESCPLNDVEAYYPAKEYSATEFPLVDIYAHPEDVLVFSNGSIHAKVYDEATGIALWTSMYIGPRPPKKPVKV